MPSFFNMKLKKKKKKKKPLCNFPSTALLRFLNLWRESYILYCSSNYFIYLKLMFSKFLEITNPNLPLYRWENEAGLETQFRAHELLNTFSPNFITCIENHIHRQDFVKTSSWQHVSEAKQRYFTYEILVSKRVIHILCQPFWKTLYQLGQITFFSWLNLK